MEYKVNKITVMEESNEYGTLLIRRLIEKVVLAELNLPIGSQSTILQNLYQQKGVLNENTNR